MGFPEELVSPKAQVVSDTQAYRQFGNAVVPAVVGAVAKQIVAVMREAVVSKNANGCVLKAKKKRRRRPELVTEKLSRRKPK